MPRKYMRTRAPSGALSPSPRAMAAQRAAEKTLETIDASTAAANQRASIAASSREPHAAEGLQRPVQKAHQELDPEEIEQHAERAIDAVLRLAARARVVAHGDFHDVRADLGGERRNEAMQLAVEAQAADHVGAID